MMKNDAVQKALGPVTELNALALANADKLANLQVDALKRYADLGLAQVRAGLAVKNPEDMKSYLETSRELAQSAVDAARADQEAVMALGNEYLTEVGKMMNANVAAAKVAPVEAAPVEAAPAKAARAKTTA